MPTPHKDSPELPRRSTWWVGRGRADRGRRAAPIGQIAIGLAGLMSFRPFFEPDVETRGWDWLPYVSVGISGVFIVLGVFGLASSFHR